MTVEELIFDKDNLLWRNDMKYNKMAIAIQVRSLCDLFKTRGYIYLNDIYERFYIKWDPHRENKCFVYGEEANDICLIHTTESDDSILFRIAFATT